MARRKRTHKEKRLICTAHGELADLVQEIRKIKFPYGFKGRINVILDKMNKVIDEVLEYGQSMEDRLYEYHDAVEGLGFKRERADD